MASDMSSPDNGGIYPLYDFDRSRSVEALHMAWLFRVDARLDPEVLRSALSQLLQIGDWRKFAGRFKRNKDGLLELHTPRSFPSGYSIIGYSHRDLPEQKATEALSPNPTVENATSPFKSYPRYRDVLCHSEELASGTIETWVKQQLPPLALHVTTFEDATYVSLLWRHTVADGGGMVDLLRAWSLVLSGREDEVPPLQGTKNNVLWQIGEKARQEGGEEWCMKGKSLGLWATLKTFFQFYLWRRLTLPKFEPRCVSLPETFVAQLKERALRHLKTEDSEKLPAISDGLILRSWVLKKVLHAEPKIAHGLLAMAVNPRPRLPELQQEPGVYVQNMLSWVFISLPIDIIRGPLATLALEIRRRTQEQVTHAQVAAFYDFKHAQEDKRIPREKVFYFTENPGNDFLVAYNDLSALNTRDAIDFGPAVQKKSDVNAGKPTFFCQKAVGTPGDSGRFRLPIIICSGKDSSGNYVFDGVLSKDTWNSMEQDFESDEPI